MNTDLVGLSNGVLFHELGHGLVAMYDLPITGKEEDAVDQLSTLLLSTGDEKHEEYAVSTVNAWGGLSGGRDRGKAPRRPVRRRALPQRPALLQLGMPALRFRPGRLRVRPQNPDNPDGALPQERAAQCPQEYNQIAKSWGTLLDPYMKQ